MMDRFKRISIQYVTICKVLAIDFLQEIRKGLPISQANIEVLAVKILFLYYTPFHFEWLFIFYQVILTF